MAKPQSIPLQVIYFYKIDDIFTNNKELSIEENATSVYIGI